MDIVRTRSGVGRGRRAPRATLVSLIAALLAFSILWSPFPPPVAADETGTAPDAALPPDAPWTWPVEGAHEITEPFRAPAHRYGPGHRGMDIAAVGSLRSPASGVVAFRGTVVDRGVLTIDHGDGYVITLEPVVSDLGPGDVVEAGQIIADAAEGGHSPPGTVHIGVRLHGEYVNPRPLFGDVPRAILYPCCDSG